MKRAILGVLIFTLATTTALAGSGKRAPEKSAAFDRFKQLAGDWGSKSGMTINYKVTSGGTCVVETIGPGTPQEMITVIHPDGDGIVLTHYCMLGNQPQMRAAKSNITDKSVAFQYVRATNMKSEKDVHMHSVTYTFVDKDTVKAEWTNYNDGKPSNDKAVFVHTRKK